MSSQIGRKLHDAGAWVFCPVSLSNWCITLSKELIHICIFCAGIGWESLIRWYTESKIVMFLWSSNIFLDRSICDYLEAIVRVSTSRNQVIILIRQKEGRVGLYLGILLLLCIPLYPGQFYRNGWSWDVCLWQHRNHAT